MSAVMDAPAWARGQSIERLRALAGLIRAHDAGLVLGAFTGAKEADVASWLEAGELRAEDGPDGPIALIVRREARASGRVLDFSGASLGDVRPGDLQIRRIAGDAAAIERLLRAELAGRDRAWIDLWQERAADRELAARLGFVWLGSKIRASSEIIGIWALGGEPRTSAAERATLVRLPLQLDVAPLRERLLAGGLSWADHYSSYNKGRTWSALCLRGFGGEAGFIIKPAEMSKKWKAEHPEAMALELADTPLRLALPEAEALIAAIPGEKHRIRLMRLAPGGGELTRHADITDEDAGVARGRTLRIHIPIITNPGVEFRMWTLEGEQIAARMAEGEAWYLDTRKPHTAVNRGDSERIHLVMDVESSPEMIELLTGERAAPAEPAGRMLHAAPGGSPMVSGYSPSGERLVLGWRFRYVAKILHR